MKKIFKTDKHGTFFIFEERSLKTYITKCNGYFMQGVFFEINVVERKEITGIEKRTIQEVLDSCFQSVYEQDVIAEMNTRLLEMGA